MAPVIEGFVRLRPDEDQLERDIKTAASNAEPTTRRAGESLGKSVSDGFREGFIDGMPRTFRDANGRLRNEHGAFVREGKGLGDAASDGFHRGFTTRTRTLGKSFHGIGGGLGRSLGGGLLAGVTAYLGVGLFKGFIDEAREAGKQSRITANVIKVTGGVANVTAKDIDKLATSISNKTAKDDEAIQQAANLLLTFKQVRNEAGKNNDVFDRGVQAAADLSVQFGGLDGAAKQMGKALNDPVKGITALARAGVTFTQQQKDQITQMVKNNNLLGAQKIILGEVESQVGGAAAAAADPLQRVGVVLDNVKETIGIELLPVVNDLSNWLSDTAPGAGEKFAGWLRQTGIPAVRDFGGWIKDDLWPAVQDVGEAIGTGFPKAISNFKDAFKDTSGSDSDLGIKVSDFGDVLTKVVLPAVEWMFETGLPALGTALGEAADLATDLGIAYTDMAVTGIEAFKDLFSASTAAIEGTLHGLDKVAFLFGPALAKQIHNANDNFGDFRQSAIDDMEQTERQLHSVGDALRAIKTDHAQQEFVSLREVANRELDAIKDEDVSVQFNLFATKFGNKKLPVTGGAGHGALAQVMSRHKWSDPGIGGRSLNVRESKHGQAAVDAARRNAYEAVADAASGIGGRNIVNPYTISARWMSYPGHTGIDLAGPIGSPVHAIGGGRVARALSLTSSYGKHVIVDHPGGWSTLYGHMSSLGVSAGDAVGGGSVVGLRGSTGNSTGPHTHFETRRYGAPINPESVMAFDTGIGRLQPGWNSVYNGTGGAETLRRVTGAVTTQVFDRAQSGRSTGDFTVRVDGKAYSFDVSDLTKTARKAARETSTFTERLADSLNKQLDKSNARFERQMDKQKAKYDALIATAEADANKARTTLDDLRSTAKSAYDTGVASVMGSVDVGALGTDPAGHLQTWASDAKRFVGALQAMADKGFPPELVMMVAQQGPLAGYDVATAFANLDASGVANAQQAYAEIGAYATQAGKLTMNLAVPPDVIAAQEQMVATLDAHTKAVEAEQAAVLGALQKKQDDQAALLQRMIDAVSTERVAVLDKKGGEVIFHIVKDEEKKAARR